MLLGGDRKLGRGSQDVEAAGGQLEAAGGTRVGPDAAANRHRRFMGQRAERPPGILADLVAGKHHLEVPGPVPEHQEGDLPAAPGRDNPPLDQNLRPHMVLELVDIDRLHPDSSRKAARTARFGLLRSMAANKINGVAFLESCATPLTHRYLVTFPRLNQVKDYDTNGSQPEAGVRPPVSASRAWRLV